jgi:hypothetical protein
MRSTCPAFDGEHRTRYRSPDWVLLFSTIRLAFTDVFRSFRHMLHYCLSRSVASVPLAFFSGPHKTDAARCPLLFGSVTDSRVCLLRHDPPPQSYMARIAFTNVFRRFRHMLHYCLSRAVASCLLPFFLVHTKQTLLVAPCHLAVSPTLANACFVTILPPVLYDTDWTFTAAAGGFRVRVAYTSLPFRSPLTYP